MKRQKRITPLPLCLSVLEKVIPDFFDHGWPKQRFGQPHEFLGSFSDIPWARPGSVRVPGTFGTTADRENTKRAGGIRRHVPVPHPARFSTGCYGGATLAAVNFSGRLLRHGLSGCRNLLFCPDIWLRTQVEQREPPFKGHSHVQLIAKRSRAAGPSEKTDSGRKRGQPFPIG